jgi:hypothetical protein
MFMRWQNIKQILRAAFLFVAVYFASIVTSLFQLPLWLWLTVEAILRYAPFWLSVPLFLYIGWQLDTEQNLSLGTGLALLVGLQLMQLVLRMPRLPLVQLGLRVGGFVIFAFLLSEWWWDLDLGWILLQCFFYTVALLLNFYRRQRT